MAQLEKTNQDLRRKLEASRREVEEGDRRAAALQVGCRRVEGHPPGGWAVGCCWVLLGAGRPPDGWAVGCCWVRATRVGCWLLFP